MDLTPANLQGMFTNFSTLFAQGYRAPTPWWSKVAQMVPSNSEQNIYGWMGKIPTLRKWVGPRVAQNVAARSYTLVNEDFELTEQIDRNKILDDQYGIYAPTVEMMGWQAAKWPDQQLTTKLQANTDLLYDGVAFFSGSHPVNINDASLGTQSNDFTTSPLTNNNYATVRQNMMAFKGDDGQPLSIMPNLLVVPPQLEYVARTILNADFIAPAAIGPMSGQVGAATNVLKGSADLLVAPELANEPTRWYLFDTSRPIRPLLFQQRQAPNFVYRNQPTDDNVFWQKSFVYGVDARAAFGYALWFLAARATA